MYGSANGGLSPVPIKVALYMIVASFLGSSFTAVFPNTERKISGNRLRKWMISSASLRYL